ncbi:MAG: MFS transporter [Caldilineaceae bacterium]|nr:MFS transporter [Caldilineaceae bacterium]MCB0143153.1 MFS transporter [Caldilineaceae bacterium]
MSELTPAVSPVTPVTPDNRREQVGWYFYDWANSAFSTTVVSVFLGPYLTAVAKAAADANGFIHPLGFAMVADGLFPFVVSLSVVLQVLFLPVLGAIADYSNRKKQLMGFFAYIGAFATTALYFVEGTNYWLGGALFVIANLTFGAAIVFYNAFLPEIAEPDQRDRVSSHGWALGYLGGGILLLLNLIFVQFLAEPLGISTGLAVRISLASAGLWWAAFSIIPLTRLRNRRSARALPAGTNYVKVGFRQLGHTLRQLPQYPRGMLFLIAYLFYNDGIQTVIALAAQFGSEELGLGTSSLIQLILMVQFVAFGGALLFNVLAERMGVKKAIMLSLVIWVCTTSYTYAFVTSQVQFFVVGAAIGVVLGGSQALSRSLFSHMIPKGREAEYFSLYEVSERGTSWLGPMLWFAALQFTGSYRVAVLSVSIFFIIGLVLLSLVDVRRAIMEVGNEPPANV